MVFQAREPGGILTQQEEQEGEHPENRHPHERLRERGCGGQFPEPAPQPPRAAGLHGEQQDGEARHEKFLELFTRPAGGERLGFLGVEERGTGRAAPGDFVELQLLDTLAVFQAHLEPAHGGHEHAHAEKPRGDWGGE